MFLDFSELPVITMYAFYVPIFIWMMSAMKDLNFFQRFIVPLLAIIGSLFMIFATFLSHGVKAVLIYIAMFIVIVIIGLVLNKDFKK